MKGVITMIEKALSAKQLTLGKKVSVKAALTLAVIAMAVILPQIVHLAVGAEGGVKLLPMYLPVIIGGCLLGRTWGLALGMLSPLASFLITTAMGSPMPLAARLPFMMAELAMFAIIAGLFSEKMSDNWLWSVPAVILSQISGRALFVALIVFTEKNTVFNTNMILSQIKMGIPGIIAQIIIVPVFVLVVNKLLKNDR